MRSRLNGLLKDRKTLYFILSIMLVLVFTLTVAYAALSTVLEITGNAEVSSADWDIRFNNVQVKSGSVSGNTPLITGNTKASFSVTLTNPGDFYEFTIDVVNDGSIDAMIDSVTKTPELTAEQAKYIKYNVEYENGESISTKQLVSANSFVRLKVKVEFRKDINASDLPKSKVVLDLAFIVNYIQADENGSSVPNNGFVNPIKIVSGNYDTIGSEICIDDECFYVITSDDDSVTMLAKYNLYVGGYFSDDIGRLVSYGDAATGKQDSTMQGWNDTSVRHGVTSFSSDSQKGTYYSSYEGSILDSYVNEYSVYLNSLGVSLNEVRIITWNELEELGCSFSSYNCSSAPSWVYSTSYWTDEAMSASQIIIVLSDGELNNGAYDDNQSYGVRPVVEISKDYF